MAAANAPPDPVAARKVRVRGLLNRLLWTESEGEAEDYDVLVEDLNARLHEAALSPDFLGLSLETLVRRLVADMGLSGDFAQLRRAKAGAGPRARPGRHQLGSYPTPLIRAPSPPGLGSR